MHKRMQSSSSGGIIACAVVMQHVKAVAVAVLALQQWIFRKHVVVVKLLSHRSHVIVFLAGVLNMVLEIINVVV